GAEAAIEIERPHHRFGHVAEDRVVVLSAGPPLAFAQIEVGAKTELAGDGGTGFAAHQGNKGSVELSLIGVRELAIKHVGHDKVEHAVAQELQALVGLRHALGRCDRARMCQGTVEKLGVGKLVAQAGFESGMSLAAMTHRASLMLMAPGWWCRSGRPTGTCGPSGSTSARSRAPTAADCP